MAGMPARFRLRARIAASSAEDPMDTKVSSATSVLAEMGLGEQAAFLRSVLEGSTEYAIVAKDLDGHILAWNEGARRIYGYDPNDVLGKSAFVLHDPEDVANGRAQAFLDEARA